MIETATRTETKEVTIYRTSDGKEFTSERYARIHEDDLFWRKSITNVCFGDKSYFCYRYTNAEDYKTFIHCLITKYSSDFSQFSNLVYEAGTLLFARVEAYHSKFSDSVVLHTYDSLVKSKQELIDTLTEELAKFQKRFGGEQ